MMSIGLYGDSFGSCSLPRNDDGTDSEGMKYHWSKKLKTYFNCELTNYADSGTSVYYSYKKFLKTYQLHDKIIFLITGVGRYVDSINLSIEGKQNIVGLAHLDHFMSQPFRKFSSTDLEILNDLRGWYKSINDGYNIDMLHLMLDKISQLKPDTIFIPTLPFTFTTEQRNRFNIIENECLIDIYNHQMKTLHLSDEKMNTSWAENSKFISGHLTPEYNEIAFNIILNKINTGKWNLEIPNEITFGSDLEKYFFKM